MADSVAGCDIHPAAVVSPGAQIGRGCRIGPFCIVGERVRLGEGCVLHSHAVLGGHLSLGPGCEVFSFACLGQKTQDLKYKGEETRIEIGARTVLREYVTVNAPTSPEYVTRIGDDCLIQSYCHVAHECVVGDRVVLSSGAMLAGHVTVGDGAVISGMTGVVPFAHIGTLAYIGAYSKVHMDVPPYCIADGLPAETRAVNRIGMTRRGKSAEAIRAVTRAFKTLILSGKTLEQAASEVRERWSGQPAGAEGRAEVETLVAFLETSEKGIARPRRH